MPSDVPDRPMEEVYQKYARSVYKYLLSLSHDEDIAEELTQETFCQAIRCIKKYDYSCKLSTWLCSIAKRQYYTYLRKNPGHEDFFAADDTEHVASSAEDEVFEAYHRTRLYHTLHALPEPFREIMRLRLFGNLSFREIGEIMGKNENWARVNFYRGKLRFRKEFEDNEE